MAKQGYTLPLWNKDKRVLRASNAKRENALTTKYGAGGQYNEAVNSKQQGQEGGHGAKGRKDIRVYDQRRWSTPSKGSRKDLIVD